MNFQEAIASCFGKYATFRGTASRREYWWFLLFCFLTAALFSMADRKSGGGFVVLITFVPVIAAGSRRLHSIGRSGWWQLLFFLPLIGWGFLIYMLAKTERVNE